MSDAIDPRFVKMAQSVDLFQGISPADIAKIFGRGTTMNVPKGEVLFYQDTVGNQMFVLLGGSLGVFDRDRQLATLRPGDTFGEMSLLLGEKRSATIKALELSAVFAMDERLFEKLLTKRVAVQMLMNISRMLARRLRDANKTIREIEGR